MVNLPIYISEVVSSKYNQTNAFNLLQIKIWHDLFCPTLLKCIADDQGPHSQCSLKEIPKFLQKFRI